MVGQRGSTWLLAGVGAGGVAERRCTLPEGKDLFFPAINQISVSTPNVCELGPEPSSVKELRATSAPIINNVSDLEVTLDGRPVHHLRRIQSVVFEATLPEDNLFDASCADRGGFPAGVYSPAVDDGIYAFLEPLHVGTHRLHIHAASKTADGTPFVQDVTYILTVVPVTLK
jgi:hypothetical protein